MSWDSVLRDVDEFEFIWPFEVSKKTVDFLVNAKGPDHRSHLAGHLTTEIKVPQEDWYHQLVDDIMLKTQDERVQIYLEKHFRFNAEDRGVQLESLWVNHQRKHEFNPLHIHTGALSFVIFCQIPYNLEDEDKVFQARNNETSRFTFVSHTHLLQPGSRPLDIDKDCVGKMLLFDARMPHMVYPFYTSDDVRITASGNIRFV